MFDGLTWNEFGGYHEGDAWAARGNEIERREQQEEQYLFHGVDQLKSPV